MTMKKYRLYARKIEGHLEATYRDGHLYQVVLEVTDPMPPSLARGTLAAIPYEESELSASSWEVQAETPDSTQQKIARFCAAYEKHLGTKYRITPAEAGKVKKVEITDELLDAWFHSREWWAKTKTLGRYVRYLAELREAVHATPSRYPDEYDAQLAARLRPSDLQAYWAHLRQLGWYPHRVGGTHTVWKKREQ